MTERLLPEITLLMALKNFYGDSTNIDVRNLNIDQVRNIVELAQKQIDKDRDSEKIVHGKLIFLAKSLLAYAADLKAKGKNQDSTRYFQLEQIVSAVIDPFPEQKKVNPWHKSRS